MTSTRLLAGAHTRNAVPSGSTHAPSDGVHAARTAGFTGRRLRQPARS